MRRTLSSTQTFLMKFVLPVVWLAGFAGVTVVMFTTGGSIDPDGLPSHPEMRWLFLGATVVGSVFLYWFCMRIKRVELDDRCLYVSNYFTEIRVPLEQIENITENRLVKVRPITVWFRRETEFGARIVFMPKRRWWGFWHAHPVVGELEAATQRARGTGRAER